MYRGLVRVETDQGTFTVPLSVNVRAITIPDAKDSGFTDVEWTLFFGTVSHQEPPVETMLANYGFSPSPRSDGSRWRTTRTCGGTIATTT